MTDPAATLQALADWYRRRSINGPFDYGDELEEQRLWAEHVEGVTQRHKQHMRSMYPPVPGDTCDWCSSDEYSVSWPCPDVAELLAVAANSGITPSTNS